MMSVVAYSWDNACIQSFHALIKREGLDRFKIRDYRQAYQLVLNIWKLFITPNESQSLRLHVSR